MFRVGLLWALLAIILGWEQFGSCGRSQPYVGVIGETGIAAEYPRVRSRGSRDPILVMTPWLRVTLFCRYLLPVLQY